MMNRPSNEHDADQFRQRAQQLMSTGSVGDELLRNSATIAAALPIYAPNGSVHSWFVPVTIEDRLAGFFQFLQDGTLMRYSSFQRRSGDFSTCPAAADWLDSKRVQSRAMAQLLPDEKVEAAFLTFDRSPDRLVWAVPMRNQQGQTRLVYVAGETVYLPPAEGTIGG